VTGTAAGRSAGARGRGKQDPVWEIDGIEDENRKFADAGVTMNVLSGAPVGLRGAALGRGG